MRPDLKSLLPGVVSVVLVVGVINAQPGGAVPVRIPLTDGAGGTRCINSAKDQVWLTLRRVITNKHSGFLTTESTAQAVFQATIQPQSGQNPQKFPVSAQTSINSFSNGQISIPIEYSLLQGFALRQAAVTFGGVNVDMTLVNLKKRTSWGNALDQLAKTADKLPIPGGPILEGAKYLMTFANNAVTADIDALNNDAARSASLALNFSPNGDCTQHGPTGGDFEKTGTIAVLQATGDPAGLLVGLNDINSYCWTADLTPAFILKAAKKDAVACSDTSHYANLWRQVSNNYAAFFLNAVPVATSLAGPSPDRDAALRRCQANGVQAAKCLAR
jgi:hypothetical protein